MSESVGENVSLISSSADGVSGPTVHLDEDEISAEKSRNVSIKVKETTTKSSALPKILIAISLISILFLILLLILVFSLDSSALSSNEGGSTDNEFLNLGREKLEMTLEKIRLAMGEGAAGRIGEELKHHRKANNPVILVPGITSTVLELWSGRSCAKQTFRDKFWGSTDMTKNILRDQRCWMEHLSLDLDTWDDPEGVKLRPASGFSAADYLFPGYWVWAKLFENMNDVFYEPRNMHLVSYDWRLSPFDADRRDALFLHMRDSILLLRARNDGRKVAMITHSMGSLWAFYFLRWVEYHHGASWIETNVDSVSFVSPPLLGVPKAVSGVVSGEMKDTAEFGRFSRGMIGALFGSAELIRFMRSLGSLPSMFPSGDSRLWNLFTPKMSNDLLTFDPLDETTKASLGLANRTESGSDEFLDSILKEPMLSLDQVEEYASKKSYSTDTYLNFLNKIAPRYMKLVREHYKKFRAESSDLKTWHGILKSPLPHARNLKIYCLYGILNESSTEYGYHYGVYGDLSNSSAIYFINTTYNDPEMLVRNGVRLGPGDGTVPLVSMAYPCWLWKQGEDVGSDLNPAGSRVRIREYMDGQPKQPLARAVREEFLTMLRGGEFAASHVEILGHRELLGDLIQIVTKPISESTESCPAEDSMLPDSIHSNILEKFEEYSHLSPVSTV